jgi:HSP20 family protein
VTLMRFAPFRELDRPAEQTLAVGTRPARSMPMEGLRRGDELLVQLDVPGVPSEDIDLTVERDVAGGHSGAGRPALRRLIRRPR